MPKVGFVVNPLGGNGRAFSAWQEVSLEIPEAQGYLTHHPGGGTEAARQAVKDGCDVVAAVGGDGTVSEVANALIGSEVALAIVPAGTGNDYARSLNSPTSVLEAARLAFEGQTKVVDTAKAPGNRSFVNVAGCGFDAEVMTTFNTPGPMMRRLPVKIRYYLSILKTFARYKGTSASIDIDGQLREVGNLLLLACGPAMYYGAGMKVLPNADLSDGWLDVVWGHDVSLGELSKLMGFIYKGEHLAHPKVESARGKVIKVVAIPATKFHLDGDVAGTTPVTFEIVPASLRVVTPA